MSGKKHTALCSALQIGANVACLALYLGSGIVLANRKSKFLELLGNSVHNQSLMAGGTVQLGKLNELFYHRHVLHRNTSSVLDID